MRDLLEITQHVWKDNLAIYLYIILSPGFSPYAVISSYSKQAVAVKLKQNGKQNVFE